MQIHDASKIQTWVKQFLDHVDDPHVDTIETFQDEDGTRVSSRWVLTGTNNGILGTEPNGKPIALTGTAVWTVDDGKLQRGWVEQASFELYHYLLTK
jgi:predicted ester cyclase